MLKGLVNQVLCSGPKVVVTGRQLTLGEIII